jgi:hypothetical protein
MRITLPRGTNWNIRLYNAHSGAEILSESVSNAIDDRDEDNIPSVTIERYNFI